MLGMVLGVASLIVVLAIMNGFAGELRGRILSLVPHGFVESTHGGVAQWPQLMEQLTAGPGIVAVAPYITEKAILGNGRTRRGAVLTAVDPQLESGVSDLPSAIIAGDLQSLQGDGFNVVLGATLASILSVVPGDYIEVTVPRLTITPLGLFPRSKRLQVTGIFQIGDSGRQAGSARNVGRTGFEFVRRVVIGDVGLENIFYHFAAAVKRPQTFKHFGLPVKRADAGWAV